MLEPPVKTGDCIELKERFNGHGKMAIVVDVNQIEATGFGGWISFDYLILTESNELVHISESCIEKVYSINPL